jgi:hypothetical protein
MSAPNERVRRRAQRNARQRLSGLPWLEMGMREPPSPRLAGRMRLRRQQAMPGPQHGRAASDGSGVRAGQERIDLHIPRSVRMAATLSGTGQAHASLLY